jgi:diguanylate cyclase (GGDEF)-like protein/PAS domain S-box-containing protein
MRKHVNVEFPQESSALTALPIRAVLGLQDPAGDEWARLRGMQYPMLAQRGTSRLVAQAIAAALVTFLYFGQINPIVQVVWLAALVTSLAFNMQINHSLSDTDRRRMSMAEFRKHSASVAATGLIWSMPFLTFGFVGSSGDLLQVWAIVCTLIAGSALITAAAPLGTILFASITGASAAASFALSGQYEMVMVILLFVGTVVFGTIGGARTFLEARIAESAIVEKDEVVSLLLREFEENQADWLWQVDNARRVRSASPRFSFALGKAPAEIDGNSFLQLISGETWQSGQFDPSLHDLAERLKRRESFSNQLVKVSIGNTHRWWELSGTPMLDEDGVHIGFRGVGSDVTEQRESSEKIAYLARYDTLTGLPNRLMLNEGLGDALRYAVQWRASCAFLMIDLDRFKAVNDSLGHLVGDQLLAVVSQRLKDVIGENERVGRLGGDEFAIVIRDATEVGYVGKMASKVIETLSKPYKIDHHTLYVGASVGSAVGPRDGSTVEDIMRNSDLALYRAKDDGGGEHYRYEPSLHALAEERRRLEFSLRHAIERDELLLNFQPVVDAYKENVVSFEALLRWNSKEHGIVSPAKFIPLAEDTRLIVPIGEWVLEQACLEAVNWPEQIRIAVNVSGEQLIEPEFASTVVRSLAKSGLSAQRLEIEVTESIFLRDADLARKALEEIMALGCSVALDDFGTGYSSLGYLRKLRFSTIKVDRSFVQGAANHHPESLAIIRAVVAMADSLEMSTTAEGVETAEEAEMIRQLGCKKIQGYYFGRPMPADEARKVCLRPTTAVLRG